MILRQGEFDLKNTLEYKGYVGTVEFSEKDARFFGRVLGIHSLISYEGMDICSLADDFYCAVDDYLTVCKVEGVDPEKPY